MGRKRLDLIGHRYGRLVVLKEADKRSQQRYWLCRCDCGNEKEVQQTHLRSGDTVSCGCMGNLRLRDLLGQRFGLLQVIEQLGTRRGRAMWRCKCDCGGASIVSVSDLTSGNTRSCGCLRDERNKKLQKSWEAKKTKDGVAIPSLLRRIGSNNKTGVKGVHMIQRNGKVKYRATIGIKHKVFHLGDFDTLQEATTARKKGEQKYHDPHLDKEV